MRRLALIALVALAVPANAWGSFAQERELAERYAPVVRVVSLRGDCAPGDPYLPIDVGVLFGEPTVALRGPWNTTDLVKIEQNFGQIESLTSQEAAHQRAITNYLVRASQRQ